MTSDPLVDPDDQHGTEFDLNSILVKRTHSIHIDKKKTETGGFSLSDLANEYLTNNTPEMSAVSNLVLHDLVGSEMTGESVASDGDFDLDSEIEKIEFSTEGLMIKKGKSGAVVLAADSGALEDLSGRLSSSLTLRPSVLGSLGDKRRNSHNVEGLGVCRRWPSSRLENFAFVGAEALGSGVVEGVHLVGGGSLFGEFLASGWWRGQVGSGGDEVLAERFAFARQREMAGMVIILNNY